MPAEYSKPLDEQCWAPPRVAAAWLGLSSVKTLQRLRRAGMPRSCWSREGAAFAYCPQSIMAWRSPDMAAHQSHWLLNFRGAWESTLRAICRDAEGLSRRVVVWVDWPNRAPMSRPKLVALIYAMGAAAVIEKDSGKVWSPPK